MAPLSWQKLMDMNVDDLMDPTTADEMFKVLEEFDPGGEDKPAHLRKLFEVTQTVMLVMGMQYQACSDKLEELSALQGKSGATKDQEIEDLKRELESLRREKRDIERFGGDSSAAATSGKSDQTRFLRDELNNMEHQLTVLQKDLREKDKALMEEKDISEKYYKRAKEAEEELRGVNRENEQLREDIRDYQRQLESNRENLLTKRDDDYEIQDRITKKNKLLTAALDENRNLAEANVELEQKMDELKKEMRDGQAEIEKTMDEYMQLKHIVNGADKEIDALRRENEMHKDQVVDLQQKVRSKADADDEIMVQVSTKVEEWKQILGEKEEQLIDLQHQNMELRDQLISANMDSEKTSVAMLNKAVDDRDQQIEDLQRRLNDAGEHLEANAALIEDVRTEMGKSGRGPADRQQQRLVQLQSTLKMHEGQLKDADSRAHEAEDDAREKDKHLSEALERMRQYESGEYGLPEAVAEIKDLKQFINGRDRRIEELTRDTNKLLEDINQLEEQNDFLRDKLGMEPADPIDLTEFKKKRGIKLEQDRALNSILQKEVEHLEEERLHLKMQMRKLAQSTGQRAVAMGLGAEDLDEIDKFIDGLKEKRQVGLNTKMLKSQAEKDELKIKNVQLDADLERNSKKVEKMSTEVAEMKAKNKDVVEENNNLVKALREVDEAIKQQGSGSSSDIHAIHCPTLERMLAAIDARSISGNYDTTLYLKAQADNLTGHNEELRRELRETRFEATRAQVSLDKAVTKVEQLETEIHSLRETGAGGFFQSMPLPTGMAVTSSDVIANLNEHLVQTLQELSLKEDMVVKMEEALDNYKRKFAVMRHQQSLLYQDFVKEKEQWESGQKTAQQECERLRAEQEDKTVRLQEFDRMLDTLSHDDVEVRRRLSDMTRKITVLRVNEKALTRRYNALTEIEGTLRKEASKLRNEVVAMETAVAERLGYLQRYKDMASFKIAALQKNLDDCVPEADLDAANRQFTALTEKHRDLLEKSSSLVVRTDQSRGFEVEVVRLTAERQELQQELQVEKEKLHTLEAAFEQMRKQGLASSGTLSNSDLTSVSQRLTTLEMKELNERQRADHANRMYDNQKQQLRTIEDRNFDLESKFASLTQVSLEQQKVERELRDELANCVTKAVSDADRRIISRVEKSEAELKIEVSKLKDISEVATTQVRAIEQTQQSNEKELTSLRQQLLDFQAQNDEKTVIGRLHRHIVNLQVSEGTAVRKLEDCLQKLTKREAHTLRTEQRLDQKDQTIFHNRLESRSKSKYLKHTIQDLRRKYAGAVPLPQQEKFAQSMVKLQEDKNQVEMDLRKTNEERLAVEDKLQEVQLQHRGLEDLIVTLQDGKGAEKVAEWHRKMETVRLEDLRLKREIERLKYQIKFQEGIIKKHEVEVLSLEEDKVRQAKEFEDRELEWEVREVELERMLYNLERQQAEIAGAASQFETAVGALPNSTLPVAQQLDQAITTIKSNVKLILDAKAEAVHFKKRQDELEKELRLKEREVLARDKVITELRLRLPATAERDKIIAKATAMGLGKAADEDDDYENRKAMNVAQATVTSLQARIQQKEETVAKYQQLLTQARDDMQAMNQRHEQELRTLQQQLHTKNDAAFVKFRESIQTSLHQKQAPVPTNDQLKRLNELEDMVAEQDNSIAALRDKLGRARQEIQDWKYKLEDCSRQSADEKDRLVEQHTAVIQRLEERAGQLEQNLGQRGRELELLQEELAGQQEANARAPTTTMKNLIERLKNQLSLKEKQHKALSKALTELRADMVGQAASDVKAHAEQTAAELNVQKLVDKATKEYQDQIEELDSQVGKYKKELRRRKDEVAATSTELEEAKHDLGKRESQSRKLKDDKQRLEGEVEELDKKIERMNNMTRQRGATDNINSELEELRRKNRLLTEESRRNKLQAEKPYEQQAKDAASSEQSVARWEESKKWQKMVDRLKTRVRDREQENEKLTKANDLLKNGLERANKDKESLETKLRQRPASAEAPIVARTSSAQMGAAPPASTHSMQDLKRHNHELEEQLTGFRRQQSQGRDAAFTEVQVRNKFLTEKLGQLEHQLASRVSSGSPQDYTNAQTNEYRDLAQREQQLQKQVVKQSEENIELRFEVEQAAKDIPRLKDRIQDLQKYVDILKAEKEQMQIMRSSSRSLESLSSMGSQSSNVRRIGESGKSARELERTIALLKKVVERTQHENEQLKKAPGVLSNEQFKAIHMENQGLKTQLGELRQKMGSTLNDRYESKQKATSKIMDDHEKIRQDLMKEMESNEKLRVQLRQRDITVEQLQRDLSDSRHHLEEAGARQPTLGSLDSKGWSAVVGTRVSEERARGLQDELKKKTTELSDTRLLLRQATQREQELLQEKNNLQEQIAVLERFPSGSSGADPDVVHELQVSRLRVDRLENEKKELIHELDTLRQGGTAMSGEDAVEHMMSSRQLMSQLVDVRLQLKTAELDRERLQREADKMKKELDNFGPDFFEEIEDLKYNYREAVEHNVQYEEQLANFSKQFGVSVDIPGN